LIWKKKQWNDEVVFFCCDSCDLHLLSAFNARLVQLINQKVESSILVSLVQREYLLSENEAKNQLDALLFQYSELNLTNLME